MALQYILTSEPSRTMPNPPLMASPLEKYINRFSLIQSSQVSSTEHYVSIKSHADASIVHALALNLLVSVVVIKF